MYRRIVLLLLITGPGVVARAQVLGGKSTFAFLDLPASPQITALGNVNVSQHNSDITLSLLNPALLRPEMGSQLAASYAAYFADVKYGHAMGGYDASKLQTTFAAGIQYLNYGIMPQTDAAGTIQGSFTARDLNAQVSASRQYLERWHYGVTLHFVSSRYGAYAASGLLADVGLAYQDSLHGLQIGLVARNMGGQLKNYVPGEGEPLPFDLQLGISKQLAHVPLQLSATLHHLYQFDVRYADPAEDSTITGHTVDKLMRHAVFAVQWNIGKYLELTGAYNYLRRQELALTDAKGASGLSFGAALVTRKIQLRYARSYYQRSAAFNHLGINIALNTFTK